MLELAIGLGAGLAGVLAVVFVFAGLLKSSGTRLDHATSRADALDKENDALATKLDDADERGDILEHNNGELLKEIATTKQTLQQTEASLASVKASHDDLVRTLAEHPGALPALVRDALERLRSQVSAAGQAAPGGDPNGGDPRSLHGPDALEPPA